MIMFADSADPNADTPLPAAAEAVFILSREGVIRFATPGAARCYGYETAELVGRSILRFIAPEDVEPLRRRWIAFRDDPAMTTEEMWVHMVTATDRRVPVHGTVWRLSHCSDFLLIYHANDQVQDRLHTLYSIITALSSKLHPDDILDIVFREVRRLIPTDSGTVALLGADGRLHLTHAYGLRRVDGFPPDLDAVFHDLETMRLLRQTRRPLVINDCDHDPRWTNIPASEHIKSWLGAPLIYRDEFLGLLNLDSHQPGAFSPEDVELAGALAGQVAAAIYHARQYEDAQRRAALYQAVSDISQAVSQLDLDSVLEVVYRKISALMDAGHFFIGLHDPEAGLIHIRGRYDRGQKTFDAVQRDDEGLSGQVLRSGRNMVLFNITRQALPPGAVIEGEMPRSLLMMPLIVQDEILGVITVQSYDFDNAYTPDDIALLETVAGVVATAIKNAQLYDQTAARLAVLETLHRVSLELTLLHTPDRIADLVIQAVFELFGPVQARLALADDLPWDTRQWIGNLAANRPRVHSFQYALPDPLSARAMADGALVAVPNLNEWPEAQAALGLPWVPQAALACPLRRGDNLLGTLLLLYGGPQVFRRDTVRTLELLAMQAAMALEHARYNDTLRRRLDEVTALQDLARRVSSSQSLDDMLDMVVRTLREVYQCRSASIGLLDPSTQDVVIRAAAGIPPEYLAQARFRWGEFAAGQVAATGRVIYVPDTQAAPNFRVVDPAIRCVLCVPLTAHDQVIGVLNIDSARPYAFSADHERLLTIAGAQIAAAIETLRLIDETRERAAQLAQANAELSALHELRNELIENLAHELRNPLALIRGYAGLLQDPELGPLTPQQAEAVDIINKRTEMITRLINDMLVLEQIRRETLQSECLDLNWVCAEAITGANLVHQARGLRFEAILEPGELLVEGDRDRLDQVLHNLIGNAAKFSPDGSTITLHTRRAPDRPVALVSITDHGIGIPPDRMPHIFERFYQGDKSIQHRYGGAGLGLAIARRIVEAHGGEIWAESQEGVGSTFTFALALAGCVAER